NGWIPGPVELGHDLPLSSGDLVELYASNRFLSADVENELSGSLPSLDELPMPADFEDLLLEKMRLEQSATNSEPTFGRVARPHPQALSRRFYQHSRNPSPS